MLLTFIEVIQSRFHVATRSVSRFSKTLGSEELFFQKSPDEVVIGKYKFDTDKIVFTTLGIHFRFGDSIGFVACGDMLSVDINGDPKYKNVVDTLPIYSKSGDRTDLLVRGGDGKLRDAWIMYTLIKSIINAYAKRQS